MSTVLQKKSLWKLFNEQASQLVQLYPEVQEEVNWRVTHLNCKWDSILSILGPSDCGRCEQETCLGSLRNIHATKIHTKFFYYASRYWPWSKVPTQVD